MLHSINPRTGAERDPIEEASVADVAAAVDRAAAAAPKYAAMPLAKRAAYLRAVADALEANLDYLQGERETALQRLEESEQTFRR